MRKKDNLKMSGKFIRLCFVMLLIIIFQPRYSQSSSEGKSLEKIKENDFDVNLYVISIASEYFKLKGVKFVLIPDLIKGQCIGKSYKLCVEQSRNFKNELHGKYPTRILTGWVSEADKRVFPENALIIEELSKIGFISKLIKQNDGEYHFDLIENDKKVRARIHWELWPNGENFRVLEIIKE